MMEESPLYRRIRWWLHGVTAVVVALSMLGALGPLHQAFDLCSHFRCQYFVLLAMLTIVLWRWKSPRWAGAAFLALLHNAVLIGPYYVPVKSVDGAAAKLTVITFNVNTSNRRHAEVLAYVREKSPDLILLIEVDNRWMQEMSALDESYPHRVALPQDGPFGIALLSKLPIAKYELVGVNGSSSRSILAQLDFNGRRIGFLGMHPPPPLTPSMFRNRNQILERATERAKSSGLPTVVAGDFNATPWSAGFRSLYAAGLTDTALGFGVQRTWSSHVPLLRIPIDHVLTTKDFVTHRRAVGPNCGSDHYPVEAEISLRTQ
jgi:endonuclease/exonuclease/phosphatase (EEP) superfamily protein YafD